MTDTIIQDIRDRVDIVDLVSSYMTLKKAGRYYKAPCPFHQEKTPSFVVSPDRQRWHCFGACHEGGDIFNFVMKWEHITFPEAMRELARRAGIPEEALRMRTQTSDADTQLHDVILAINSLAVKYYTYILEKTPQGEEARAYLAQRGTNEKIAQHFGIGYAPESWNSLTQYLVKKGYKNEQIAASGLVVQSGSRIYDRFRGRLMFPIANTRGEIIGFSGRLIKKNPSENDGGKYVNTPETLLYHKKESLYGIHLTKDAIAKAKTAIVVEGEFDLITPYQYGIENIVAVKGSALTSDQLRVLKRYCERLVLTFDADAAGLDAVKRAVVEAEPYDFELYIARIPDSKDPDDAAKNNLTELKKSFAHPIPVYDFLFEKAKETNPGDDAFAKKEFAEELIPYIAPIKNPIVQTYYVDKLAIELGTSSGDVRKLIRQYFGRKYVRKPVISTESKDAEVTISRLELMQRTMLATLLSREGSGNLIRETSEVLTKDDFTIAAYGQIFELMADIAGKEKLNVNWADFGAHLPAELQPKYDELYLFAPLLDELDPSEYTRMLWEYKKLLLKDKITVTTDENTLNDLSRQLFEVEKRLTKV